MAFVPPMPTRGFLAGPVAAAGTAMAALLVDLTTSLNVGAGTATASACALTLLACSLGRRSRLAALAPQTDPGAEVKVKELTGLTAALDTAPVLVRDLDGRIRHWSVGCGRLFGFSSAEACGRLAQELLRTRYPDGGRRTAMAELLERGEWRGEMRHRCRDGRAVDVASHWILQRDSSGAPALVIETSADASALKAAEAALRAGEARLRLAQEVAGVGTWEYDTTSGRSTWSREQHALFGTDPAAGAPQTEAEFLAMVHPDDQHVVARALAEGAQTGEYEAEFRVIRRRRDGLEDVRWVIGRGRRLPGLNGRAGAMLGVNVDITARKEAEDRQRLLMREVDHRAKNALAVVLAALRLTRADSPAQFVKAVEGRVSALARAQTLLAEARWSGADLRSLLAGELAPFISRSEDNGGPRAQLSGPAILVSPVTAQPLSMAIHELATNAVKYGALSSATGTLYVSWEMDPASRQLRVHWREAGGPAIEAPPTRRGFGTRVISSTIKTQLGGDVESCWAPGGLQVEMCFPLSRAVNKDAA